MAASPPLDDGNGRVTLAVLSTKLDALTEEVRKLCDRVDRRTNFLEEKMEISVGEVKAQGQVNETNIARLEERQRATTGVLATLSFVAASIAGAVGSLVK